MKLAQIALVAVLSAAFVGPAFAAMTQADMDMMKTEADKAGKTDESRMAAWKTMTPERQAAWKTECSSAEATSMPASDVANRGDIPSFCKVINSAK